MRFAAALLLVVAACTVSPSASTATPEVSAITPASSPSPVAGTPGAYAVMVLDFLDGGSLYTVSIVDTDGQFIAASGVPRRSIRSQIGSVSTSKTTLYYLDGDSTIRFIRPKPFAKGIATQVNLGPNQVAAFAVSPDDLRIAVSVLDYTHWPVSTRLYVEDLKGGANHVELFSSSTVLEWPAGWHNGALVMAIGRNSPPQNSGEWFERGHGYHVADAKTGNTIRTLCNGGDSYIPESPAGTVCVQYPNVQYPNASVVSWDGSSRGAPLDGGCPMWGPLSPDGVMANRSITGPGGGCRAGDGAFLLAPDGTNMNVNLPRQATPVGWIDSTHLIMETDIPPGSPQGFLPTELVVDIISGVSATIEPRGSGFFATALPGGL